MCVKEKLYDFVEEMVRVKSPNICSGECKHLNESITNTYCNLGYTRLVMSGNEILRCQRCKEFFPMKVPVK